MYNNNNNNTGKNKLVTHQYLHLTTSLNCTLRYLLCDLLGFRLWAILSRNTKWSVFHVRDSGTEHQTVLESYDSECEVQLKSRDHKGNSRI